MKTVEQKRREAYNRLVEQAQAAKKELDKWRAKCDNWPHDRIIEETRQLAIGRANDCTRLVFDFHNRFGYPLPDLKTIYCP